MDRSLSVPLMFFVEACEKLKNADHGDFLRKRMDTGMWLTATLIKINHDTWSHSSVEFTYSNE